MPKQLNKKQLTSVVMGSALQWYDFALFGTLAPVIGSTFFPHEDFTHSVLNTFLVFFVSFLLVPIGAIFFGYIGDRYGRTLALRYSIICMTIPTVVMGLMPGYSHIGVYASLLIVVSRLFQGFAASPEFSSSAIYLVEMASPTRRSMYGCLTGSAYSIGFTIGGYIAAYCVALELSWAWRVPFLLSIFGALIIFYIRKGLPDLANNNPTCRMLSAPNWADLQECLPVFVIAAMQGIFAYGGYVWMITYIYMQHRLTLSKAILIVSIAMLFDAVIEPFIAIIADNFGRKKIACIGIVTFGVWIYPCIYFISCTGFIGNLVSMLVLSLCIAISCCAMNALTIMHFPQESRCRKFSISFNTAISIFGGSAPLILTYLGNIFFVAAYFFIACFAGIIFIGKIKNAD